MTPEKFFLTGYILCTHAFASRGNPQPLENGKRARYERLEVGPYEARFGIFGEIKDAPLSSHDLIFEICFGSHSISAVRINILDERGVRIDEEHKWVEAPTDADLVALSLLWGEL